MCQKPTPQIDSRNLAVIYGSFVTQIWYLFHMVNQILASMRTVLYSKQESGMHMTEMLIYDWSLIIVI